MPFTRHTISGDASAWHDAPLVGLSGRIEHNLGSQSLADEKGRLGSVPLSFDGGAFSVDLPASDDATVVAQVEGTLQYRVLLSFTDPGGGGRRNWDSGWFSLTADVNAFTVEGVVTAATAQTGAALIAQVEAAGAEQLAAVETAGSTRLGQIEAAGSDYLTQGQALVAQQQSLADIDTPDELVANLVPASSGSATAAALSETIGTEFDERITSGVIDPLVGAAIEANPLVDDLVAAVGTKTLTRTNLHPNPSFEAGTTGWGAIGGTITDPTTDAVAGTKVMRVTATGTGAFTATGPSVGAVTPGEVITLSAHVRGTVGRVVATRAFWTGATANTLGHGAISSATTWDRKVQTVTVPAGATALRVDVLVTSTGAVGEWIEVDAVLVEKAPNAGTYFDGSNPSNTTQEYAWTGTAHLSPSTYHVWVPPTPEITDPALADAVQLPLTKGVLDTTYTQYDDLDHVIKQHSERKNWYANPSFEAGIDGFTGIGCTVTNPTTDAADGTKVLRAESTITSGFTVQSPGATKIPVTPGETITFSFKTRGTLARVPYMRAIWTGATATAMPGGAASSTTEWQRKVWTTIVPAGATEVLVYFTNNNSGAVGDWYEIDSVQVEKGDTPGNYFDGTSADTDLLQHAWEDTPHLSASVQAVTTVPEIGGEVTAADLATKIAEPEPKAVLDSTYVRQALDPAPETVLQQHFARVKGTIGTDGKAAIAFRGDHWANEWFGTLVPLFAERMIPWGYTPYSRMLTPGDPYEDDDSTDFTWAQVEAFCIEQGGEIWSHSRSHVDTVGTIPDSNPDGQLAALVDEIAGSKAELEGFMPKVKVQGWMMPGNPPASGRDLPYIDWDITDLSCFYTTRAGLLLRQTYPVCETDAIGYMRPLPTGPHHGAGHATTDNWTFSTMKHVLDRAIARKMGVEFMTHAGLLDQPGRSTVADHVAFLDYVAQKVDEGVLDVVTPSGLYMADPGTSNRTDLIAGGDFEGFDPATAPGEWSNIPPGTTVGDDAGGRGAFVTIPGTGGLMRQDYAYAGALDCNGEAFMVEAWARRNQPSDAAAAARVRVGNAAGTWQQDYDTVLAAGSSWQRIGACFTFPLDVTDFRLDIGRLSGGAVDLTDVHVKKV